MARYVCLCMRVMQWCGVHAANVVFDVLECANGFIAPLAAVATTAAAVAAAVLLPTLICKTNAL